MAMTYNDFDSFFIQPLAHSPTDRYAHNMLHVKLRTASAMVSDIVGYAEDSAMLKTRRLRIHCVHES